MARGDSRLGTWQVLLTISMVITPLSAHGESHPGAPMCVCACLLQFKKKKKKKNKKAAHVHECDHTCADMETPDDPLQLFMFAAALCRRSSWHSRLLHSDPLFLLLPSPLIVTC